MLHIFKAVHNMSRKGVIILAIAIIIVVPVLLSIGQELALRLLDREVSTGIVLGFRIFLFILKFFMTLVLTISLLYLSETSSISKRLGLNIESSDRNQRVLAIFIVGFFCYLVIDTLIALYQWLL